MINNTSCTLNIFLLFHINVTYGSLLIKLLMKVINYSTEFHDFSIYRPWININKSREIREQIHVNTIKANAWKLIKLPFSQNWRNKIKIVSQLEWKFIGYLQNTLPCIFCMLRSFSTFSYIEISRKRIKVRNPVKFKVQVKFKMLVRFNVPRSTVLKLTLSY